MTVNDDRDFEHRVAAWLRAAAPVAAPGLADQILRRTAGTPQRRPWTTLSAVVPTLGAVAAVAVAVVVGLQFGRVAPDQPRLGDQPLVTGSSAPTTTQAPISAAATPTASTDPASSPTAFSDAQSCTNATERYSVEYPADWFANEEIAPNGGLDGVPACQYFAPTPFETLPNAGLPPVVAISFQRVPEETSVEGTLLSNETTTVAGHHATVREFETREGSFMPAGTLVYQYLIALDDGTVLLVSTDSARDGDYDEHRDVLDSMMQTLELDG